MESCILRPVRTSGRNMPIDSFLGCWRETGTAKPSASFCQELERMGPWACRRSRRRAVSRSLRRRRTAKFDGMPESAIAAGVVDFVLPPAGIARQLVTMARHSYVTFAPLEEIELPGEPDAELGKSVPAVAERYRSGFHALQTQHAQAAHQAAHGPPRIRKAGRLHPGSRSGTARKPMRCARTFLSPSRHSFGNPRSSRN